MIAPYPCPALLELLGPAVDAIALATYAATGGTWPPSTARDLGRVSGPAALALLRVEACACPSDPTRARAWHLYVRADAELDQPRTPHGRAVRGTARPWPSLGQLGDCRVRSARAAGLSAARAAYAAAMAAYALVEDRPGVARGADDADAKAIESAGGDYGYSYRDAARDHLLALCRRIDAAEGRGQAAQS